LTAIGRGRITIPIPVRAAAAGGPAVRRTRTLGLILLGLIFGAVFISASSLMHDRGGPPVHVLLLDPPATASAPLQAQISGAVRNPGIYPVKRGDRVADLIASAGGFTAEADLQQVNEAQHVTDGDRVQIPVMTTAVAGPSLVRINHAGRDQLLVLPGVTVQQAAAIVGSVRSKGPLTGSDDLVQRRLVASAQAAQLDPLVDWSR
jgi:DNA uptake protein ComE-like DNA-binding protein